MAKKKKSKVSRKNRQKLKSFISTQDKSRFIDRDISLLAFQERVLSQAADPNTPLLDQLRFLSIFHSNIDDFFMKRMWISRHYQINQPDQESHFRLLLIQKHIERLFKQAHNIYKGIKEELFENNIEILQWQDLNSTEQELAKNLFFKKMFPVLTPIAVDLGHPFPHISSLSTSLAISIKHPKNQEILFSRLKIPEFFPSFYCLSEPGQVKSRWIRTEDIITEFLPALFPKMEILETMLFRITRNIEVESDDSESASLLEKIETELRERRYGEVVKLEYKKPHSKRLLKFLKSELEIYDFDIYEMYENLNFSKLNTIINLNRPELKYSQWVPQPVKDFADEANIFQCIKEKDILVHHPFESFSTSVEALIWSASEDPNVLAIKMTFYRTNEESSIVPALIKAAENGKQVVCLIELQARLDEERNIEWASKLERAGCHVVYGVIGLKTHCKVALIIRKEQEDIQCYAHIGSGNYNSNTAKLYTDVGLFTARDEITGDIVELFHFLTGRSLKDSYGSILKAPVNLKSSLIDFIDQEAEFARKGKKAEIIFKCNNLEDRKVCEALYRASNAGVDVQLIVRSICTLIPGLKGLSENIRVVSIVDRFLEHSRVFYFRNGQSKRELGRMYLGSADLMYRNLQRRVEVLTPILDPIHIYNCLYALDQYLTVDSNTWELKPNGLYERLTSDSLTTQNFLMNHFKEEN